MQNGCNGYHGIRILSTYLKSYTSYPVVYFGPALHQLLSFASGWVLNRLGVGRHLPGGVRLRGDALTAHPRVDPSSGCVTICLLV